MNAYKKGLYCGGLVDENLLEPSFLDDYDMAKDLRENADYKSDFSRESAEQLIAKAKKFLGKAKILLNIAR